MRGCCETASDAAGREGKRGRDGRKLNAERRAALRPVVTGNLSALILDQPVTNAEAKPGAFSDRLGRVKRIEHEARIANAGAGVGEKDDDIAFFKQRPHGKRAAAGFLHGIHGVVDDVGEHLEQLIHIRANFRDADAGLHFDADVFAAKIEAAKLRGSVDDGVDVERRALLAGHLAGEAEQIVDQRLGAPRLFANFFGEASGFFAERKDRPRATRNIPEWP